MGNSKFYYYPQPDGRRLVTLDLGEMIAELFSDFEHDVVDANLRTGGINRSTGLTREIVTIQRDRMIGGESSDKAYAYPLIRKPESYDSAIGFGPNPFSDMAGAIIPATNDYVVLETESPSSIREQTQLTSVAATSAAGGTAGTQPIVFTYPTRVFMRHYRFWPLCLRRPASDVGQNIVTNEGGRLFSLNIRLMVDLSALFAFHRSFDGIKRNPDSLPATNENTPPFRGGRGPLPFEHGYPEIDIIGKEAEEDIGGLGTGLGTNYS
jgi:hypothetical protein